MYRYFAFGLTIQSELSFPELLTCPDSMLDDSNRITISFGKVNPDGLNTPSQSKGLYHQATESMVWLNISEVGRFLIQNGNQIIIDPIAGADHNSIRLFILGSCMGALLMQRNLFLLHANAIKINNYCISFSGNTGIGKSTLSGAFLERGYSVLADDVCAISITGHVIPSFPQIKLCSDTANYLKIETKTLRKIRPGVEKFAVPLKQKFHHSPLPLKVVYILQKHDKNEFNFTNITGIQKIQALQSNTYRRNYLKGLAKNHTNLQQCIKLASTIDIISIMRPNNGFQLEELVALIEHDLAERKFEHAK